MVVVRHPMPYADLKRKVVQRFAEAEDFVRYRPTIEEREEYEPLVGQGLVVYAGIDYRQILAQAEMEAYVIVWDGGNNDTPFFKPNIHVVVFDALRPGHGLLYFPGETNLRLCDLAVINKVDAAPSSNVAEVRCHIAHYAPATDIILSGSPVRVDAPEPYL
jgi:predicted GTPase